MKSNPVLDKSFAFALRIVKLYKYLIDEKHEFVLSKELLISETHIGKHIKEAVNAESKQFLSKKWELQNAKPLKQNIGCNFFFNLNI